MPFILGNHMTIRNFLWNTSSNINILGNEPISGDLKVVALPLSSLASPMKGTAKYGSHYSQKQWLLRQALIPRQEKSHHTTSVHPEVLIPPMYIKRALIRIFKTRDQTGSRLLYMEQKYPMISRVKTMEGSYRPICGLEIRGNTRQLVWRNF